MTATSAHARTTTTVLRSDELSCPSCIRKIEGALQRLDGVERATVHFGAGRIEVEHDPATTDVDALVRAVRAVGYEARPSAF